MSDEHRRKLQNSGILSALVEHVKGEREMSATQVTAGVALLKKFMPDLQAVQHSGEIAVENLAGLTDDQLATIAAAGQGRANPSQPPVNPRELN
jgi:hypothetical protein